MGKAILDHITWQGGRILKLNQGEHSILATFSSSNHAQMAMEALKQNGIEVVQIDRISRYPSEPNDSLDNPLNNGATSQVGLSLYGGSQIAERDASVLLSSDNAVSGMAARGQNMIEPHNFLLTVVTSEQQVDPVVSILKQHGAIV